MTPHGFHDLPASKFPLTIRAHRMSDDVVVWTEYVEGPAAIYVPPLAREHGPVAIEITYADGDVARSEP